MRVVLTSEEFTEIDVTQGTLQNLSPQAAIEIVTEETENSGIVLYPRQKLTFSHETTVYARSVWDTVTDGETVVLAVEPIFNESSGGGGSYTLPTATANRLGGVKIGDNVTVQEDGTISVAAPYTLPTATNAALGGVKIGSNISIDENGVISTHAQYTLPIASASTLGGVKVGTNLNIDADGVLSATGTAIPDERLWKAFAEDTAYSVGDVFRTPSTPSWGYWQVTTAGTSGSTVPSGTTEGDTATSGTMECVLSNIISGGGGGAEYVTKARAWAMSSTSPDGEVDATSPTGYTQSSKTWAETSKTGATLSAAWADSPNSPDGQTDTDSPTGYTQSAKTWEEKAKYYGVAAEQFATQTEVNVQPSAWSASTTYNYPDVVYYTDGYNYRCVGTNVTGTELPGVSQNWVCLSRVTNSVWEYDTQGGLMPVINPVGDSDWEIDENGGLMPTAAV